MKKTALAIAACLAIIFIIAANHANRPEFITSVEEGNDRYLLYKNSDGSFTYKHRLRAVGADVLVEEYTADSTRAYNMLAQLGIPMRY